MDVHGLEFSGSFVCPRNCRFRLAYSHSAVFAICAATILINFRLTAQTPALANTHPATFISPTTAQLNGMAVPNWPGSVAWFEWGSLGSYGQRTEGIDIGSGHTVITVSTSIVGLTNRGIYQFRLAVSNSVGVVYGALRLFTTGRKVVSWSGTQLVGTVAAGLSNIVEIAESGTVSYCLTSDGTVGSKTTGQPILTNVIAIAAGDQHRVALLADHTVTAWGNNSY